MEFKSLMHLAFYTDQLDVMRDFYENKLGLKPKVVTRAITYKGLNKGRFSEWAETDPDKVIIVYIEIAPGQFIELFPKAEGQKEHDGRDERLGYSHFSLLVDDIYKTRDELIEKGITPDSEISMGPSKTYKMWIHDPDGNMIEIMQFTDESIQLIGNV